MLLTMLLAAAQPMTDPAPDPGVGLVDLVADASGAHCLPDGQICFALPDATDADALPANLVVSFPGSGDDEKTVLPLPAIAGEPQALRLWPHAVWVRGGDEVDGGEGLEMLVGVIGEQRAMYSGGGGSGSRLHLLRFGMAPHAIGLGGEVLDVAWDSSLMIRACFSEEDMTNRQGACHDEYRFSATLTPIAGAQDAVLPPLAYSAVATASPRTSRRNGDNSRTKLRARDLEPARDPVCSYRRTLRFNPATSRYEMDRPAPDCSEYTTP